MLEETLVITCNTRFVIRVQLFFVNRAEQFRLVDGYRKGFACLFVGSVDQVID